MPMVAILRSGSRTATDPARALVGLRRTWRRARRRSVSRDRVRWPLARSRDAWAGSLDGAMRALHQFIDALVLSAPLIIGAGLIIAWCVLRTRQVGAGDYRLSNHRHRAAARDALGASATCYAPRTRRAPWLAIA